SPRRSSAVRAARVSVMVSTLLCCRQGRGIRSATRSIVSRRRTWYGHVMRVVFTLLGVAGICAYAFYGALLINDWAVAAASELPLAEAVSAMEAAGEAYSPAGGFSLAAIGIVFAIGWAVMTLIH